MARVSELSALLPGDPELIAGYRVLGRLGAGGQGVVFLALAPSGDRVAIKQLRFGAQDERARRQFVKEVSAARLVAPFCTAQVLDVELAGLSPYVVSEYIDGLSLQQRIEQQGPMTDTTLHRLAIGTITALAAIHQAGVVHRDFKPANVMLAPDGPRVIDFGIARDLSTETTVTSRVFGTPVYMAPEQLRGDRVGSATDIFAWASVIAYAATGHAPFEAPNVAAVMQRISADQPDLTGVPAELVAVLRPCLNRDPTRRPSAQQVLASLLGRPAPAHDAADATQVLAEATGIVHADAAPELAATQALPQSRPGDRPVVPPRSEARPQPGTRPPPVDRPGSGPGSGRARQALLPAAAVLVLVLGGALAFQGGLIGDPDDDPEIASSPSPTDSTEPDESDKSGTPTGSETTPAVTETTAPATTTAAPVPDGTIPAEFDGDWQGRARQSPGNDADFTVRIELEAGQKVGRLRVITFNCSGPLTLTSTDGPGLTFDSLLDDNPDGACIERGTLRLVPAGPEQLAYTWTDAENPEVRSTAVLLKD